MGSSTQWLSARSIFLAIRVIYFFHHIPGDGEKFYANDSGLPCTVQIAVDRTTDSYFESDVI